ncbi:AraC family transcriptional regulator [Saccharothrix sp. AJ9571]|nr:AraC family transcriptional regulator [Saccharothrix sp. AJ9571]
METEKALCPAQRSTPPPDLRGERLEILQQRFEDSHWRRPGTVLTFHPACRGCSVSPSGTPHVSFSSVVAAGLNPAAPVESHQGFEMVLAPWTTSFVDRDLLGSPIDVRLDGVPRFTALLEAMCGTSSHSARRRLISDVLIPGHHPTPSAPAIVASGWRVLMREHGKRSIADLTAEVGCSHRQLSRLFTQHIGLSPKRAARALRLRRALCLLMRGMDAATVAAQCGFSDQAHLSRECRQLADRSLRQLRSDGDGGHFLQDLASD